MKTGFRCLMNNLPPSAKHFILLCFLPPCPLFCLEKCREKPYSGGRKKPTLDLSNYNFATTINNQTY